MYRMRYMRIQQSQVNIVILSHPSEAHQPHFSVKSFPLIMLCSAFVFYKMFANNLINVSNFKNSTFKVAMPVWGNGFQWKFFVYSPRCLVPQLSSAIQINFLFWFFGMLDAAVSFKLFCFFFSFLSTFWNIFHWKNEIWKIISCTLNCIDIMKKEMRYKTDGKRNSAMKRACAIEYSICTRLNYVLNMI